MTPTRWKRIKDLFAAASDLPPSGRPAFLERECGQDHEMKREVDAILAETTSTDVPPVLHNLSPENHPHPILRGCSGDAIAPSANSAAAASASCTWGSTSSYTSARW